MIQQVRKQQPLVHCITNYVAAPFQANGLLALGASPIMADAVEEAKEVAAISSSVSLNIGTLKKETVEAMLLAGHAANAHGIPVILDPVGAGATPFRLHSVKHLLEALDIALIRGNAGELAALVDVKWQAKGVDAGSGTVDLASLAQSVAKQYGTVVALSGETDYVSDGTNTKAIEGGHVFMERVTGMGCLLSSVAASFIATNPQRVMDATVEALQFYKRAGERAAIDAKGPGHFQQQFLDALSK